MALPPESLTPEAGTVSHTVGLVLLLVASGGVGAVTRVSAAVSRHREDGSPAALLDRPGQRDSWRSPWA